MKRIITLVFLAVMLCLSAPAQSHLTFLGIPIDGDAYSFCDKLKKKGFIDNSLSKRYYEDGVFFMGNFRGYNANVFLCWNGKTRKVCTVTLTMKIYNGSECKSFVNDFLKEYESIYTIDKIPTKKRDFSEILFNVYEKGFSFGFLNRLLPSSWFSPIGEIDLIFSRDSVDEYSILITFNDMANSEPVAASCPPVQLE